MSLETDIQHMIVLGNLSKDLSIKYGGIYRGIFLNFLYDHRTLLNEKYIDTNVRYQNSIGMTLDGKISSVVYTEDSTTVIFRLYSFFGGTMFKRMGDFEVLGNE